MEKLATIRQSILDLRFWILDLLHQSIVELEDFGFWIYDFFRPEGRGLYPNFLIQNLKSKIPGQKANAVEADR